MVDHLRHLWYEVLQRSLECPVCLDIPKSSVFQCENGHNVCVNCRKRMLMCPVCKGQFIDTRNLVAETLAIHFEEMKSSLLEPAGNHLNGKMMGNLVCASTQTEDALTVGLCDVKASGRHYAHGGKLPNVGKGNYPCRIGSCTSSLPHARIINHLRYYHKDAYYQFTAENGVFFKKLVLAFKVPKTYDFAFEVKNLGLFFVNIKIQPNGDLKGIVQLVNSTLTVLFYTYKLKIGEGDGGPCYDGQMTSCRSKMNTSSRVSYLEVLADDLRDIAALNGGRTLTCLLTISIQSTSKENGQASSSSTQD